MTAIDRRPVNPWPAWLVATTATFAALETRALLRRDIPTLSENLARWTGNHPRKPHGQLAPMAFLAAAGWLAVHVATWTSPQERQR